MTLTPSQLLQAGELEEAVSESLKLVKKNPTESNLRFQLAELSCILGDLERADRQLDTIANQDPHSAVGAALFRQLVRAELARRECFEHGRIPEFVGEPSEALQTRLRVVTELREGDIREAASLLSAEEPDTDAITWNVDGTVVNELRDLDDLLGPLLEVFTSTGKYFWIDWRQILSLKTHPPVRAIDLIWRQATISIDSGPDGDVYLPSIYCGDHSTDEQALKLGRRTEWQERTEGLVRGKGQKTLLAGDKDIPLMELESIERCKS